MKKEVCPVCGEVVEFDSTANEVECDNCGFELTITYGEIDNTEVTL